MDNSLRRRLLQDLAEMKTNPYPNILLHFDDNDITKACFVLNPAGYPNPMHLTVEFPVNYPLVAPKVRMDSDVEHPNVFDSYVCASILNTTEGYTPAYTLKGIAIQLLSFFGSDSIQQSYGGGVVNLGHYKNTQSHLLDTFSCRRCSFGSQAVSLAGLSISHPAPARTSGNLTSSPPPMPRGNTDNDWPALSVASPKRKRQSPGLSDNLRIKLDKAAYASTHPPRKTLDDLPQEVLLMVVEKLETEDIWKFREAFARIGSVIIDFDVIRTRELQCFCLKQDYLSVKLGVGVSVVRRGKFGTFESEFDLLSTEGFNSHQIRSSVQGIAFAYYLPLPISWGHWRKVKDSVPASLQILADAASLGNIAPVKVIYSFMNDVVVKLNQASIPAPVPVRRSYPTSDSDDETSSASSLSHASEKAIESYFHLFHLLICMATQDIGIVNAANSMLNKFAKGGNSKDDCPNLGHLLVAALVSTVEMTPALLKSIIKETVTRNVVWMLDRKGSNMPELSYIEPSKVSTYRLQKTFEAGITSYRLLMFLNLFRRVAVGHPRKPLVDLCDEAFGRHGAPPRGSAKGLADAIKRIHKVTTFPRFLKEMGIENMTAEWFTTFLRDCIESSIKKGYHCMPISKGQALWLRQQKDHGVETGDVWATSMASREMRNMSFFGGGNGAGYTGGRGGRGGGRGGYEGRGGRGGR